MQPVMKRRARTAPRIASVALAFAWTVLFAHARDVAAATRPAAEQEKIDWLLTQIQKSDAVFIRNGTEYDGAKAASHIRSKLWWAGKRVQTARDFIQGVASHSEESGKPYEIRLKGAASPTKLDDWLLARLTDYEKEAAARIRKKT